ncbi:ABC multidrug transporter B [Paramyrothecium foliicola]|nr:ABC multidrug transporter B [Paramyrothecium foliicola]
MSSDRHFGPHHPGLFDFTILFEQSILSLLPTLLFILLASWRISILHRRQQCVRPGALLWLKLVLIALYAALQVACIALWSLDGAPRNKTSVAEAALGLVEAVTIAVLCYLEHLKSTKPSAILNTYLVITILLDIALTRTFWIRHGIREIAGVFTATLVIKALLLCLEEISKQKTIQGSATSRETSAGVISRTFFWWLNRLLYRGTKDLLRVENLDDINEKLDSTQLLHSLETVWMNDKTNSPTSLIRCTFKAYKWQFLSTIPPRLLYSGFTYAQPFLIDAVIRFIASPDSEMSIQNSSGLIGATLLIYIGLAVTGVWYKHMSIQMVTMFRGGLVSLLFKKTVSLKTTAIKDSAPVTLMTTDMDTIIGAGETLPDIWASFIDLPIGTYLLYRQVGYPSLFVLLPTVVMTILSGIVAPAMEPATIKWATAIQKRVGEAANMLAQMKSIKMMGLTHYFHNSIHQLRIDEVKASKSMRWLVVQINGLSVLSAVITPMVVILASIYWTKADQGLSVAEAFTSLSIIALVAQPLVMILIGMMQVAGIFGSFSRMQTFLRLPEQESSGQQLLGEKGRLDSTENKNNDVPLNTLKSTTSPVQRLAIGPLISLKNATFGSDEGSDLLHDIDLVVNRGTLNMIVGKVGCGKSTLLKALIGELPAKVGDVSLLAEAIAYCDQTPWLRNTTIRNNITNHSALDEEWLATVARSCALDEDLAGFPSGDLTIVGSGGITLSGGQKQRVALARAVYARKELLVLDDVFSGLDNTTARLVFQRLLESNGLLRLDNTTIVLATSNINFLPAADHITLLDAGRITRNQVSYGSVDPLIWGKIETSQKSAEDSIGDVPPDRHTKPSTLQAPLVTEADFARQTGDTDCYKIYLRSWGKRVIVAVLVLNVAGAVMDIMPQVWLKLWVEDGAAQRNASYTAGYVGFSLSTALIGCVSMLFFLMVGMPKSSINLHLDLLTSITRAPLHFFTSTDSGNILNRFSQDMTLVDQNLPSEFLMTLQLGLKAVAQTGIVASGASYVGIAIPPSLLLLWVIQKYYLRTSRQLRFLDLEAKTPLYTQFTEMIAGLATIRAFGWSQALLKESIRLLDTSQKPFYTMFCIQRWLALVLDMFVAGMALVLVTTALRATGSTSQGAIGLAMVNLISFNITLTMVLDQWTRLETSLGAIARLKWVKENVPNENKPGEEVIPTSDWPARGAIEFDNVTASYSDTMQPVLHNVSIKISAGQKVGICGRSGSGKSSTLLVLLRLLELSSGTIRIDDVDLSTVPREHIRSHITTIPQDPVKFRGSIRQNLDPESCVQSDDTLVDALRKTNIWNIVEHRGGLDADLSELGFSIGQQQLFSLARALLQRNSIILLDEATSSVDRTTDHEIRRIILQEMSTRTVIEVAHKLEVVRNFDIIIVMSEGRVVEMGNPDDLLAGESALKTLWEHRGL